MVTAVGGPEITVLLKKLEVKGWSLLFLQRDIQYRFAKLEMYKFYERGEGRGSLFSTSVHGQSINLVVEDIPRTLVIPNVGWDRHVRHEWPSLENLAFDLEISRKFSCRLTLVQHRS